MHYLSWKEAVFESPKCLNCRISNKILDLKITSVFYQMICLNLSATSDRLTTKMPIELGRYLGTQRDDRICELCRMHNIGDEFHYMLECTNLNDTRKVY